MAFPTQPDTYAPEADMPYGPSDTWLTRISDVWFSPLHAFSRLSATLKHIPVGSPLPLEAVTIVIKISALGPLLLFAITGGDWTFLILRVIAAIAGGLLTWNLATLFFAMLGFAITGKAPWKRIYIFTAYALCPWIFLAPTMLIKFSGGEPGEVIGSLLCCAIWLWSAFTFCCALKVAFEIRLTQLVVLLLLPVTLSLVWGGWLIGFAVNLVQFLSN